jgi:hypothetical protein
MVRALLAGQKEQTRRLARRRNGLPSPWQSIQPGDRLWVREAWYPRQDPVGGTCYRATFDRRVPAGLKWRTPLFMPRERSRIMLEVEAVRVERLQAISDRDARREGVGSRVDFHMLWMQLHGQECWAADPEVVVIGFQVIGRVGGG